MQAEPRWLTRLDVVAMHVDQLQQHGGYHGLLNDTLLDAALERPRNKFHYDPDADLADLAAAYAFAIVKTSHPFLDGNKRTGFIAAYAFLGLNGYDFTVPVPAVADRIFRLAAGRLTEEQLATWFRASLHERKQDGQSP
jgi:death-on-curing protein